MKDYNKCREERARIFLDTEERIKNTPRLSESVKNSIASQVCIRESENIDLTNVSLKNVPCRIRVTNDGTMAAASEYSGKVVVLNFASATNPGGGVAKGSSAQEECLCRVSTLYDCISTNKMFREFYNPHRLDADVIHNDDIIYTPNVTVFKNDKNILLDESDWFNVDVITCAAPNLRDVPNNGWCNVGESNTPVKIDDDTLQKIHEKRAKRIIDVAASKGADVLVLGAFGCGAFKNPPRVVANAYKNALTEYRRYYFKTVVFAVLVNQYNYENLQEFQNAFAD